MNESHVSSMESKLDKPRQLLLEFLLTPLEMREKRGWPRAQAEFAEKVLGVSPRTAQYWKKEPQFRAEWDKEAKDLVGDPTRVKELLDMLANEAKDPDHPLGARVKAVEVVLRATDALKPPTVDTARRAAAEMSDAELDAFIAEAAQAEKASRAAK